MIQRFILPLILLATAIGCQAERPAPRRDSTGPKVATAQAPATQPPGMSMDDDGCDANPKAAHSDPQLLVYEYLERGGRGEFLASSAWHDGAVECPGHAPGFDSGTLVTGWRLSKLRE